MAERANLPLQLDPEEMVGGLVREDEAAPIAGATWYVAEAADDGLSYRFPEGALAEAKYLTADLLVDGDHLVVLALRLQEGEGGPTFMLLFSALNQCQARLRMRLEAVDQNRWRYDREGAWLKPMCAGDRVDLAKVDRMTITVLRKSDRPARFCLTPVAATAVKPERLDAPVLPKGPLLDELGQSALHEWPTKSRSAEEVTERLRAQAEEAEGQELPEVFTRWGGWKELRFEGTGFFRTHHDGKRWWLVDPDGCAFWSAGLDCVGPHVEAHYAGIESAAAWMPEVDGQYAEAHHQLGTNARSINYLGANFIRAFGPDDWYGKWSEVALGMLRQFGFNTVANWSDWRIAKEAGFPYVRPLDFHRGKTPRVFRDFPDVFHSDFEEEATEFAKQLEETRDDPALIGYFLMNEPTWGFAQETPAAGMLHNTAKCEARLALRDFLKNKYGSDAGLAAAWGMEVTLAAVGEGEWRERLTKAAEGDLESFSAVMVEKLFAALSDACKKVDPNHLNLGARYYTVPPPWALEGMTSFDVFSVNGYQQRVRPELLRAPLVGLDGP